MSFGIRPPGFRLPESTQVGTVHLQVADLARSLTWYRGVLGLRVLQEEHFQGYVSAEVFDFSPGPEFIAQETLKYLKSMINE